MGGIDFAAHKGKNIANSTLIRTVIRGLLKNGHKKTPQENSYGVWDRKKALILSYQRLFFRRYLILNLTPRSLPPKNIVLPTNSMFSYPEAGKGCLFYFVVTKHYRCLLFNRKNKYFLCLVPQKSEHRTVDMVPY